MPDEWRQGETGRPLGEARPETGMWAAEDSEEALEEYGGLRLAEQTETGRSRVQEPYPGWEAPYVEASLALDFTCESLRSPEELRRLQFAAQEQSGRAVLEPGGWEVVTRYVGIGGAIASAC